MCWYHLTISICFILINFFVCVQLLMFVSYLNKMLKFEKKVWGRPLLFHRPIACFIFTEVRLELKLLTSLTSKTIAKWLFFKYAVRKNSTKLLWNRFTNVFIITFEYKSCFYIFFKCWYISHSCSISLFSKILFYNVQIISKN